METNTFNNDQMIFQNMSMLVFNAINRGVDQDTAVKEAESVVRALIAKSKEIASSHAEETK